MIVSRLPLEGGDGLFIPLLPPSFGRRWRVAPEVGFPLFRLRPTPALRASPFLGKGADGLLIPLLPPSSGRRWRVAPEVGFALFRLRPTPCPSGIPLPWEGGRWATHPASPSFLWKEVARSAGGWLRSLFAFDHPPALRASPFHGKGVDGLLIPLLPPSSGRRWRVAPEVGFALFRLQPTPCHGKGVDGLLTHSSTLHYPFTENGFQILATFIELKMNLKIGQSHYF